MVLYQYSYILAIGTMFALLDAYNNGANDVANSWATSVSSRSISYRWAMVLATVFEFLGALTVGARTADTIKNGIIPLSAFQNNAGVQMLAFTCALAAASMWVMWCTRHSAHVSSTYSLISAVAGVGVALAGASNVNWGWNGGQGMGAIFAGLAMAPVCAAGFASIIYGLIFVTVHMRKNPVPVAIWTAPFFFLIAGTVCTLSIVYKGSPSLGLASRPASFIVAVSLGVGGGLFVLSAIFFVPYLIVKVIRRDPGVRFWHIAMGPALLRRPLVEGAEQANVPNYAVIQHDDVDAETTGTVGYATKTPNTTEKDVDDSSAEISAEIEGNAMTYKERMAAGRERFHAKLRAKKGALGWAMRYLHENPMSAGEMYERKNIWRGLKRIPAMVVVGCLYGANYDIHAMQTGIAGTPEAARMERVHAAAHKYPNEVEYTYSFVQIITACTASFAHGANDIGNAVGPWAVIYGAWKTGNASQSKAEVPTWQLAVVALTLCIGFITYGYNIMKVMGNKITYHSPSRGSSMEMGAAITILVFSQYKLPVSTSMCITGATVGVGLCNGNLKAVNWQRVGLLVLSWIVTIPIAGTLGGVFMGIILNAPDFRS
ncbi:hypothetical protein AMS68_006216 [Peltaster fructicola]|uniref:Phosphate transporter n=1 Tax=Peltaster fructicola TaxID=286661 RepID=A0A6H0Y1F8_9PEZI|nr:hypothetical protein AMS68_006216 [Peltaster fructicola]